MSDKTELEEMQWKVYKDGLITNTRSRFLRSAWRKEANETKVVEIKEEVIEKVEVKIKKKSTKKSEKKSNSSKLIKLGKRKDNENEEPECKKKKKEKLGDADSNNLRTVRKNINGKEQIKEEDDFMIKDEGTNSVTTPATHIEESSESNGSILPYELVAYKHMLPGSARKDTFFNLHDKMRYNKKLDRQLYIGRLVVIEKENEFVFATIEKAKGSEVEVTLLDSSLEEYEPVHHNFTDNIKENVIDNDEDIFMKDAEDNLNKPGTKTSLLNTDEHSVYLVEYMFYLKPEPNSLQLQTKEYALVVSLFKKTSDECDLLIEPDENCVRSKKVSYNGFIVHTTKSKIREEKPAAQIILKGISKINCDRLFNMELSSIRDELILKLYNEVNVKFKFFLKLNEFHQLNELREVNELSEVNGEEITLKKITINEISTDMMKYLLQEIIIFKQFNGNNYSTNKMYLLLNYNKTQQSIYVKSYRTGETEWINLEDIFKSGSIFVNELKGKVAIKSLDRKRTKFYKHLSFALYDEIPLNENYSSKNVIILPRKFADDSSILQEVDCSICTYKLGSHDFLMCKFCNKVFHIMCLSNGNRNIQNISEDFKYWACEQCRPCRNCHNNENSLFNEKLRCQVCSSCYHLKCINPKILSFFPNYNASSQDKWRCENCLKCSNCEITCESGKADLKFSANYAYCLDCEKRYEKKEYCPICRKLWTKDGKNMIECKCKFWVHQECDRILTDEYFKKIVKKTYHCPPCRIKKKNKHFSNTLEEMIKLDKHELFYHPVDSNIPNYTKIIKMPMSFSHMKEKLEKNNYLKNIISFFEDVDLIFNNTMTFHMPSTNIYKWAEQTFPMCKNVLDAHSSELYQASFEYYLFDFSLEDCNFSAEPEKFLKSLENRIRSKFSDKVDKIKPRANSTNHRLNEYKMNWSFVKDFMEKNFNVNVNNEITSYETYSLVSEAEKMITGMSFHGNKIIVPKSIINCIDETIDIIKIEEPETNQEINCNVNTNSAFNAVKRESEESVNNILTEEVYKIENEPENELKILTSNSSKKFQIKIEDDNIENMIKKETISQNENNDYISRKRERGKPKWKTFDFQQELDTYNSNFEVNKKAHHKFINNPQTVHKMEINENSIDLFNPFLALEEEEDNIIRAFEKVKANDPKASFLYPTKYKTFINESDKDEYSSYLDMMASYVFMKDDKRKRIASINIIKKNSDSEEYSNEELRLQTNKAKKGRPSKRKFKYNEEDKVNHLGENTISRGDKTIKNAQGKEIFNNSESEKKGSSQQIVLQNKTVNVGESNKFKTECELYQENINLKNLLPFPAQVCFSSIDLIYEKNCYLCGSFDDTNLFLTCSICFENFHSYCISNSPLITQNIEQIKKYKWKCQNCKFCECCEQNGNDNLLLYCDSCDRALHTYCLDVKLHMVPESGWKCLSCFQCQSCGVNKYYKPSFPINKNKDYSIFTRNFNYCFECGLRQMFCAFCVKCQKSDFKRSSKNLIFIQNREDYDKHKDTLNMNLTNSEVKDNIVMLNCSLCKNWFHSDCLGIDNVNLKYYFEELKVFNCLDCHIIHKYGDRYLEITFIKYLDVLKMSFTVMCFSKLIMIILKSICSDSNIKLHSKLLKLFLKENLNNLLKDKSMCLMLELIRMDVFMSKDKSNLMSKLKKKKSEIADKEKSEVNFEDVIKTEIEEIEDDENSIPLINSTDDMMNMETELSSELVKKNKLDKAYISKILRKYELETHKNVLAEKERKKFNCVYDVVKNNTNTNTNTNDHQKYWKQYSESVDYDSISVLKKIKYSKYREASINKIQSTSSLGNISASNNQTEININVDQEQNLSQNVKINEEQIIDITDIPFKENIPIIQNGHVEPVLNQEELNKDVEMKEELSPSNTNSEIIKANLLSKKKRKRISLISEKMLSDELENFFKTNNEEVKTFNSLEENKFVDFYNFDVEDYYKGGDGYGNKRQNSCTNTNTTNSTAHIDGNQIITETIDKLEKYLKLTRFSRKVRKFIFNLILTTIITLKQSLLQWLLTQMMNNNESGQSYIQKNNVYQYWVNYQSQTNGIINNDNFNAANSEYSEEEITKFLDYIDPIEDSPSRNFSCEFCLRKGARKFSGRLLYIKSESWGHVNCILWSKGIQESVEGNLLNVAQMLNKIRLYKCCFCRKYGATVCCDSRKCGKYYHFTCAHAKQCIFLDSKLFYCNKCANTTGNNKEECFADFNTRRRFIVVRNPDFVNDYRTMNANLMNLNDPANPNIFKILPKYLMGSFNKFGNTTVLKFLQANKKDFTAESIDIALVKFIEKPQISVDASFPSQSLLLLMLNESGIFFSDLTLTSPCKEFEEFLQKFKLSNCFEKTEVDAELLKEVSKKEILLKTDDINFSINNYNSKEKIDLFSNAQIKRLNSSLDEYVKTNILTEEEVESSKRAYRKYNDWMSFFNVNLPFNIIMKYQGLYLNMTTEYSEGKTSSIAGSEVTEMKNKKESKTKLENYVNIIKMKNSSNDHLCFRFVNYIESHQQKIFKKSLTGGAEDNVEQPLIGSDRKTNKANKQTYKNLNKTMSTNIMEMDLPLAMKFRNYKSLRPRVTIGPSAIHRNGLFTTESFQAGEIVIEYVGELITNKIADYREQEYIQRGFGDCYMFRLDQNHIIDATKYGNLARFINHCCDPNCSAQANQIGDKKHIILYAKRPIKAHEEITYDYNFETEAEKIMCRCGAINCQGRLN